MSDDRTTRKPLHARPDSVSNTLRLVPSTPPRLLGKQAATQQTHPKDEEQHPLEQQSSVPLLDQGLGGVSVSNQPFQHGAVTHTTPQPRRDHDPLPRNPSTTRSPTPKPKSSPKNRLEIHKANKTFSLLKDNAKLADNFQPSAPLSTSKRTSSRVAPLSHPLTEVRSLREQSCDPVDSSKLSATPAFELQQSLNLDPPNTSPWNYRLVGGLRKVPNSPGPKLILPVTSNDALPRAKETSEGLTVATRHLNTKSSFHSTDTASTTSESTNYKIYSVESASSSDTALLPLSPEQYHDQPIRSAFPAPSGYRNHGSAYSDNRAESEQPHGFLSLSSPQLGSPEIGTYSQESLVIPHLARRTQSFNERVGYQKARSTGSLRIEPLPSTSRVVDHPAASSGAVPGELLVEKPLAKEEPQPTSSWTALDESAAQSPRSHMNEHPHQWSSQLSTVHSVSDGGTDRDSRTWSDDNGRRSSGFLSTPSRHSRQMLSVSSSLAQEESRSRSRGEPIELPQPSFARNGLRHLSSSSARVICDQDEHGDGLTDMLDLRTRPSRTRLSGFYSVNSSDNDRTNTMMSTTSSRANSLLAISVPTWARLYYGSGERRYLGAPGSSTEGTDSRASSFLSGSPSTDHFPLKIYSPRRRPRELSHHIIRFGAEESLNITPAPQIGSDGRLINDSYSRRFRTWSMSSVWSPHLRVDRRAACQSVWEPPSLNWGTDGSWFGRRNLQVSMFVGGFIFPLAWIAAAFFPLPGKPVLEMSERDSTNLGSSEFIGENVHYIGGTNDAKYESAKWWRTLNRWMSLVGLLVIATVVTLGIVGMEQGW